MAKKSAKERIVEALKKVEDSGRVNARRIYKGYNVRTGQTGWHTEDFGSSEATYLGKSAAEAVETIEDGWHGTE